MLISMTQNQVALLIVCHTYEREYYIFGRGSHRLRAKTDLHPCGELLRGNSTNHLRGSLLLTHTHSPQGRVLTALRRMLKLLFRTSSNCRRLRKETFTTRYPWVIQHLGFAAVWMCRLSDPFRKPPQLQGTQLGGHLVGSV